MTSLQQMTEPVSDAAVYLHLMVFQVFQDVLKGLIREAEPPLSAPQQQPFTPTRAMTAHCWLQLRASFTEPLHPCSHTDGEIQGHKRPHKKHRHHPPLPIHRHTRLWFHPRETVHIQTNTEDGYCPKAIIWCCPSPWVPEDNRPSVDEASSMWMGG